jgi:hypothetical protein
MSTVTASQLDRPSLLFTVLSTTPVRVGAVHYEILGVAWNESALDAAHVFDDVHVLPARRFVAGYLGVERVGDDLVVTSHGFPAARLSEGDGGLAIEAEVGPARVDDRGILRMDDAGLACVPAAGTILVPQDERIMAYGAAPYVYVVHGPSSGKIEERIGLLHSLAAAVGVPGPTPGQEG